MKPTSISIEIPNPCHESWHDMTPCAKGRFCNACQKPVLDFTHFSDAELFDYLSRAKQPMCGRFTSNQVNKTLYAPTSSPRSYTKALVAFIFSIGITIKEIIAGTSKPNANALYTDTPQHHVQDVSDTTQLKNIPSDTICIRGNVCDSNNVGIAFINITLAGIDSLITTDVDGNFKLYINRKDWDSTALHSITFTCSMHEYQTKVIHIAEFKDQELQVELAYNQQLNQIMIMGELVSIVDTVIKHKGEFDIRYHDIKEHKLRKQKKMQEQIDTEHD